MDEKQKILLIEALDKYTNDTKESDALLSQFPLTGPKGLRKFLAEKDSEYFCQAYLPELFDRKLGDYAIEILNTLDEDIKAPEQRKRAIIAPREHGKSTMSSTAVPTKNALYQTKKFILFISANGDTAANFLEKCKKALTSPAVIEDFGNQKGHIWNADSICTTNGVWISCTGWKSGIRGLNKDTRPDLIILDDLEDKQTMESDAMRQKLEQCFREEIGRLGYYKTDFFYIGTLLSEDALLARVAQDPAWRTLFYKCVVSFPLNENLWENWRKIYRDINNPIRFDDAYQYYLDNKEDMDKGVKVLWPDRFPESDMKYKGAYYNIMLNRESWGEDAFWKEDQNEPRCSSDRPFKQLTFWEERPRVDYLKLTIDPSEGKGQDGTAYTLGGKLNGGLAVWDGQLKNHKLNAIMAHAKWYIETYPEIEEILIEENTYKEDGTEQLRRYLADKGVYRKVTGFRSTDNKYNRIIAMEPDINNGIILFNRLNVEYNNQILGFSRTCKHDDAADSLHMLWKSAKKPKFELW